MKFSLFRRSTRPGSAPAPKDRPQPRSLHPALPGAEDLTVYLQLQGQHPFEVDLYDMNIQGAELRLPFHLAPLNGDGEVVELDVYHPEDAWRVRAIGEVRSVEKWDEASVIVSLRFTSLGDLYAQLDDALGRYFNRRSATRVKPDIDQRIPVKISYGTHRVRGLAQDVSRTGLGVMTPLVQAVVFQSGERVRVEFELPDVKGGFDVPAVVKHGYRRGEEVLLGLEFDLLADSPMRKRRAEYAQYVDGRREAMEAWQKQLSRSA